MKILYPESGRRKENEEIDKTTGKMDCKRERGKRSLSGGSMKGNLEREG